MPRSLSFKPRPLPFKPRPKLPPWDPTPPKKPRRIRIWPYALLAWLLTVGLALFLTDSFTQFSWLAEPVSTATTPPHGLLSELPSVAPNHPTSYEAGNLDTRGAKKSPSGELTNGLAKPGDLGETDTQASPAAEPHPPRCEQILGKQGEEPREVAEYSADLTRSAWGRVQNGGSWLEPCRRPFEDRVRICLVVRDGKIEALSVDSERGRRETERCIETALLGLAWPEESVSRVLRSTLTVWPKK